MNEMIIVYFIASAVLFLLGTLSGAYSAMHGMYKQAMHDYAEENKKLVGTTQERVARAERLLKGGHLEQ